MARETLFSLQRGTFGRSKEKRVILTVREVNCFGLHLSAGKSAGRLAFLLADYGDAEALWMQLPFLKRKLQPRGLIGWRKIHATRLKFRTNDQTAVGSKSRTAPEPVTSFCLLDKSVINQMKKKIRRDLNRLLRFTFVTSRPFFFFFKSKLLPLTCRALYFRFGLPASSPCRENDAAAL